MISDFGHLISRGLMVHHVCPAETWGMGEGQSMERQEVARPERRWSEMGRPQICLQCEIDRPRDPASLRYIPMILMALVSMASSSARCEAGAPCAEGRAELHQAAVEGLGCEMEFQVCQGRTLYNRGCSVSDRLWRPTWKCGLPKKDHC